MVEQQKYKNHVLILKIKKIMFKIKAGPFYSIETSTCQAGQLLRPNGEDGVHLSCLLKVSNFEPAVFMILKNLVSKRT